MDEFVWTVYAILQQYVNESLIGVGAIKGAPCTITSIIDGTGEHLGEHTITFQWTASDNTTRTGNLMLKDGKSITNVEIITDLTDGKPHLIEFLSDGTALDAGVVDTGAGHEIIDSEGVALPNRSKLRFNNAVINDDETNDTTIVTPSAAVDGLTPTYIVGSTPYGADWLSLSNGGNALTPSVNKTYVIVSDGEYRNNIVIFDGEYYSNLKAEGSGSGTSDYRDLIHKPSIGGVILNGNLSLQDVGIDLDDYYDKTEVDALISAASSGGFLVVSSLPLTDISTKKIYLLPKSDTEANDLYDEFIFIDGNPGHWEKIGTTRIDLSSYYTKSEVDLAIDNAFDISVSEIESAASNVFNPSNP